MSESSVKTEQPFDIVVDQQTTIAKLRGSQEVERVTEQIDVSNPATIVSFGSSSAEEISKTSDVILRNMNMSQLDESNQMLQALSKIMDQFNIDEINANPSKLSKLFGSAQKKIEKILNKYHTMGDEVDKIYVQLKQYESEINASNQKLETMFQTNIEYFHELEKYIVGGEQGCQEIADYIEQRQQELAETEDQSIAFEIQNLQQAQAMLEQRTQDLRTAEMVAMQSIPMIKTMQYSNLNLIRKINSAFIVTLPVFKQALAQAVMLKRQKLQADAISALDHRTNEMLMKNAANTVNQAKLTTAMASGSSIKMDTLENTWKTIMSGLEETKRIQENARSQRIEDQKKLEAMKSSFANQYKLSDN